jgi:uncharacterized protein YggT (Ycf19 family)
MVKGVMLFLFVSSISLFWILVIRIWATLVKLNPYHPMTQTLFAFTEVIVKPFRYGFFSKPSKVDLAVIPPMIILAVIIFASGINL